MDGYAIEVKRWLDENYGVGTKQEGAIAHYVICRDKWCSQQTSVTDRRPGGIGWKHVYQFCIADPQMLMQVILMFGDNPNIRFVEYSEQNIKLHNLYIDVNNMTSGPSDYET